jgi:hypothetical protein
MMKYIFEIASREFQTCLCLDLPVSIGNNVQYSFSKLVAKKSRNWRMTHEASGGIKTHDPGAGAVLWHPGNAFK